MTHREKSKSPEYFFRDLVETMAEAVWVGDKDERTIYANQRFCDLIEYTLEEIIGKESYDFWDVESKERVKENNEQKRKKGERSSYEGNLVSKSGKLIPVVISGSPIPGGGTVGIMTDMREFRKLEKKSQYISQAVNKASDCIFSYKSTGEITSWNKGSKDIFGYRQQDLQKNAINQLFPNIPIENLLCRNTDFCQIHLEGRDIKGNDRIISGTITPIDIENISIGEYLFIGRDISTEFILEEKIDQHCSRIKDSYIEIGLLQRKLDYIRDVVQLGRSKLNPDKHFYDSILRSLLFLSKANIVQFWECEDGTSMTLLSSIGTNQLLPINTKKTYNGSANEKCITEGKTLKIINPAHRREFEQFHAIRVYHDIYSVILVPVGTRNNPIGVFELYMSEEIALEAFENKFIDDYIGIVGLVIETIQLRKV